ncbi:hypothetical protein ACFL2Q_02785 [Thermodesulfobacteriota bacterium]
MDKTNDLMDILDKLAEALGDSDGQSLEEIQKDIEEEGVDYKAVMGRLTESVEVRLNELRRRTLDQARDNRIRTESVLERIRMEFATLSLSEKLARLKDLADTGHLSPSIAYRDLSHENDEDLASIYEDAELARIMANEQNSEE